MGKKYVVVQGAQCTCKFGFVPDVLKVNSHSKFYASDVSGADKLIATTKELGGGTFQANSFGQCKLQPRKSGFKVCKIKVAQWTNPYENVALGNGGKILTEKSKAICPIGGSPCISVIKHGQAQEAVVSNGNEEEESGRQLNPMATGDDGSQEEVEEVIFV